MSSVDTTPLDRPGLVIAVDGTSGSGKSSTSRGVAERLGLRYLDTGAMFRAITWWLLREGIDVRDRAAVAAAAGRPDIESGTDPLAPTITVDGVDVSVEIRGEDVTAAVSPVSAVPEVRARLLDLQREVIGAGGIVVEGRDIGSVVWPQAEVKVYLSADPDARAERRAAEQGGTDVASTQESLLERDRIDSGRATAPLTMADGAVHVDSTHQSLVEVIDRIVALAGRARPGARNARDEDRPPREQRRAPRAPGCSGPIRPVAAWLMRRRWPITVHQPDHVPASGGVILAANHVGIVDGPLLATYAPRPVHALTKSEMFDGRLGRVPARHRPDPAGPLRPDPGAIRSSLRVIRDGGVVGIFPEGTRSSGELDRFHHGAAYLALVTGAPVVPVTLIGTRAAAGRLELAARARRRHRHRLRPGVADDTAALAPHPGTGDRDLGVATGAHAVRAGQRRLADAPILVRDPTCGTIRGRPRHRARREFQRAVITHE